MGAVAAVALAAQGDVELIGQGETGKREAHSLGLGQSDPHVFDEMLDEESRLEAAVDDSRAEIRERPASRRARRRRIP